MSCGVNGLEMLKYDEGDGEMKCECCLGNEMDSNGVYNGLNVNIKRY
jgi:hypothetical protein